MTFSSASNLSSAHETPKSTYNTSDLQTTQPTSHPEAFSHQHLVSRAFQYRQNCNLSSSTANLDTEAQKTTAPSNANTSAPLWVIQHLTQGTILPHPSTSPNPAPLPIDISVVSPGASPASTTNTPTGSNAYARQRVAVARTPAFQRRPGTSSILRPACAAKNRLLEWKPSTPAGLDSFLAASDANAISRNLVAAYGDRTRATYGAGLLLFHNMCDARGIADEFRAPISQDLLAVFISEMVGIYSASAISNYVAGLRAWHIVHRFSWSINQAQITTLLQAAVKSAPPASKRARREPWTVELLTKTLRQLDSTIPLDAAVMAAALSLFWGIGRTAELTVPSLSAFDNTKHVQVQHISTTTDRQSQASVTVIHIPQTKAGGPDGEDIFWSSQSGAVDPNAALENHLTLNRPQEGEHLFTHTIRTRGSEQRRPLTRTAFLRRIDSAATAAGLAKMSGHAFRIGGTLEYLLRGVPFDVVKTQGRWASNAFQLYLRKHAQIMAPYVQEHPAVHDNFIRYTMPPVR